MFRLHLRLLRLHLRSATCHWELQLRFICMHPKPAAEAEARAASWTVKQIHLHPSGVAGGGGGAASRRVDTI